MASSKETYCLCGQPYNIGQFMIECDCCREWFHGSCVDVKIYHSDDIDKYHCPKCAQTYGPSVLKIPTNNHRADRYELSAETRPSQVGTPAWVRALAARPPRPHPASHTRMLPQHFTEEFVRDDGFNKPVLFPNPEGLEMKTPSPQTFTVRSVLRFCGAQLEVEVIDVRKQSSLRMPLIDFVDYFETPPEHRDEKVLNVLSLEFSDTNMAPLVEPPSILKRLDWAEVVWPAAEARPPRPAVQRYCLMSSGGSYTDFHVDFGGTTVWYHVLHGRKTFYLIPPTTTNLALYQQWSASNNQNERFFGDMVEWYGTVELVAGQTLFIPTGWIHAVLTPCDSLVFGGNLLHSYAIEMQLQIYEIERRVETPTVFRYPLFEAMHWYAGAFLLTMLRRHNEETQDEDFTISEYAVRAAPLALPALLLRGVKILANALKEWHALKSTDSAKRDNVPKCLNSGQLVRELCKELRTLEKRSASAATKDKDVKIKTVSPKKPSSKAAAAAKKSLKLTLPKPIMHNAMGQNGDFVEDKVYADKFYIDNKEVVYTENRYIPADTKYMNGLPESKELVYTNYQEVTEYQEPFSDRTMHDKKNVLRIKMNNSPTNTTTLGQPPPYPLPEHSILKSHLVRGGAGLKPSHHWSISKKDIGDYQEEQQILYTNDNVAQGIDYGPGMYSAEDIQQEYEYVPTKAGTFEYGYAAAPYTDAYPHNYNIQPPRAAQVPAYSADPQPAVAVSQDQLNGSYHNQLPSYDAAIAHHYQPTTTTTTTDYVIEEQAPPVTPVRRSERPVRRRVSNTYDYEDGDLYIDSPPAPRRRARHKHGKHAPAHKHSTSNSSSSQYRPAAVHTAPANGIESLIQASVLAEEEPQANEPEDAAVEGMLSISSRYAQAPPAVAPPPPAVPPPPQTFGLPHSTEDPSTSQHDSSVSVSPRPRSVSRRAAASADEDLSDEEDVIKEVHRDEEYVYPSLEMSSDEDEEWQVSRRKPSRARHDSRSKSDKDESWSPRARLGRLVPRLRGPARKGVRRECVRAALSHAARAQPERPAHAHAHKPQPQPHPQPPQNAKRAVLESKSKRPPPPPPAPSHNKNIRLKKGMKTAKQRLGKILKIHKMIY